jgi:photosystem II stability/assembly factor-like uncharacterized protein
LSSGEVSRELYKSDDHGVTWTKVATYEAKGESVTGLAYDPSTPDRVYVAVSNAGIRKSDDGGQSWTDLGLAEQKVNDLALGVDGASLYAATDTGVFRMPLR